MSMPPDAPRDPQPGSPPPDQPGYPTGAPPAYPAPYPAPGYPAPGYPAPGYAQPGAPQPAQPTGYSPFPTYPRPPKRRPSAWWFLPGAGALVLALVLGVYGGFVIASLFHTDGYVRPGPGQQTIVLDGTGEHMLFAIANTAPPTCTASENGASLVLDPVSETETVDLDTGSWVPFASFSTDGRQVQLSCNLAAGSVRVGAPAGQGEYMRIGFAIIAAGVLGLAGLAATILVSVLYLSRPSRKVTG